MYPPYPYFGNGVFSGISTGGAVVNGKPVYGFTDMYNGATPNNMMMPPMSMMNFFGDSSGCNTPWCWVDQFMSMATAPSPTGGF